MHIAAILSEWKLVCSSRFWIGTFYNNTSHNLPSADAPCDLQLTFDRLIQVTRDVILTKRQRESNLDLTIVFVVTWQSLLTNRCLINHWNRKWLNLYKKKKQQTLAPFITIPLNGLNQLNWNIQTNSQSILK